MDSRGAAEPGHFKGAAKAHCEATDVRGYSRDTKACDMSVAS